MLARVIGIVLVVSLAGSFPTVSDMIGDAHAQDLPSQTFHLTPSDLPAPYATQSVANSSDTIPRMGRVPRVPVGFAVSLFTESVKGARRMVFDAAGALVVARSRAGRISLLTDDDRDGRADTLRNIFTGLNRPHGMAFHGGFLWVADLDRLYRVAWNPGDGPTGELEAMSEAGVFGSTWGHWTRNIAFGPDGRYLYVSIGSRGNIDEEEVPRATIQRFELGPDGRISDGVTFASGLRNPVGLAFTPGTDRLFTVVNERDGMGDGLVPDYFTEVAQGDFFGWPYAYSGSLPQPRFAERRPDLVAQSLTPDVLFQSHSAPIGLTFLQNAKVPDDWRDDALVTLRGSWNAAVPTGYKVVRVEFEDGKPTGRYINFLTGFRVDVPTQEQPGPAQVWGRPVGVAVGPEGAIFIGDEVGGTIWKIEWAGS